MMATAVLSPSEPLKKGKVKKNNMLANMECFEEELSPAQQAAYSLREKEFQDFMVRFDLAKKKNAIVLDKNDTAMLVDLSNVLVSPAGANMTNARKPVGRPPNILRQNVQGVQSPVRLPNSTTVNSTGNNAFQIVMNPRLGMVVSTVNPSNTVTTTTTLAVNSLNKVNLVSKSPVPRASTMSVRPTLPQSNQLATTPVPRAKPPIQTSGPRPVNPVGAPTSSTRAPVAPVKAKRSDVVDLTDESSANKTPAAPDSKEFQFNKLIGKTYPSLVVVARPQLKQKELTPQIISQESASLDAKVKSVLMFTPTKFTEWLIQQGLVRSEQFCTTHVNPDMTPVKLKLGMYSDASKFPFSGGYVWISDCCPQRFVSVFSGSIFEDSPHPPTVILKLIYHWSCQTVVQNILSWVKVDSLQVKNFFTNLRSVCTAAVHEKCQKLGGPKKRIEVGVISLGTTTSDGNTRQVKVEVLGVYEPDSQTIRLRAVEPLPDNEKNFKKRFAKILQPLVFFVDKESTIITDYTVDKTTLTVLGYKDVIQSSSNETDPKKMSNATIMTYLRKVVPRMFQNTLSLLSRHIMQQFLDELVWREKWGYVPAKAFSNMIVHISEQTKLDSGNNILARMQNISADPFKNWKYSMWKFNCKSDDASSDQTKATTISTESTILTEAVKPVTTTTTAAAAAAAANSSARRTQRKRTSVEAQLPAPVVKPPPPPAATKASSVQIQSSSEDLVYLESYYCGTIPGDSDLMEQEKKGPLNMKCCVCRSEYATNIQLMTHLIGHALSEDTHVSDRPQCRYCLRYFNSELLLQSHLDEAYARTGTTLMCTICEEKFRDRTSMILHMHRNHYQLELPYECGICGFRTSQHTAVVDHFYDVHSNGEKVQCPFCLKIVAFANNGRKITQNMYFFLNHIQKHKRKTIARKCNKCALWFVHKGVLKEHQVKDHATFKDTPEVQCFKNKNLDAIMMPRPLSDSPILERSQLQKTKESLNDNNATVNKFNKIEIFGAPDGAMCCECEGEFLAEEHFNGFYSCMRCPFGTCCSKAMLEHCAVFHDTRYGRDLCNVGKGVVLEKELHCVCGFKSATGNKLAKHLVICGRKSAYPSSQKAAQSTLESQSASFPPLVNLDDHEAEGDASDKWLQAFVNRKEKDNRDESVDSERERVNNDDNNPPSMLDVLGLVRKPSTD